MAVIRGSALTGFVDLVAALGGDPVRVLSSAHLTVAATGDPDVFLSYRSVLTAIEGAAVATRTPDFGRRLARHQSLDILGPLAAAARTASTVGAALGAIEQFMSVYSTAVESVVDPQPGRRHARYEWRLRQERPPPHRQAAELAVSIAIGVFGLLLDESFVPSSVHFRHQSIATRSDYERYFGCPVRFGAEFHGFLFPRSALSRPLAADDALHDIVRSYLGSMIVSSDEPFLDSVRRVVRRALPTGALSLDLVAHQFALHPRTLQRALGAEGTGFAAIVDEVRREEADHCLAQTDMTLTQMARVLSFSEPAVVSRARRRWHGTTAQERRRQLRTGRDGQPGHAGVASEDTSS